MQSRDNRFKIGILGGNGLLGSDLVKFLSKNYETDAITRKNYEEKKGNYYKVFINANGNSRRFWANQNLMEDFFASTVSVYKSVFDFYCDMYIYISSPDVYENHTEAKHTNENEKIDPKNLQPYGFHKLLGELIIKKYKEKFLILRSSMILGTNLKKGPIYDIIHNNPIQITLKTKLQLITTRAIADIIETTLRNSVVNNIINVGGKGNFAFTKIRRYFDKKIQITPEAETQIYEMNVEKAKRLYPNLKTSEEYLQEFLKDYKDNL